MKKNRMKKVFAAVLSGILLTSAVPAVFANVSEEILLHYDFEGAITQGQNHGAVIANGYARFDGIDDYIHMPNNLVSGHEDMTFVINVRPEMYGANQFTFTVGTGDSNYLFLNTNNGSDCKAAITNVGHWKEYKVTSEPVGYDSWASVAVVMDNHNMRMYVDGKLKSETTSDVIISGLGDTNQNYLAKSQYANDVYFKGYIEDFRIYRKALSAEEIALVAEEHAATRAKANVWISSERLNFDSYTLTESISLPEEFQGFHVEWKSENEEIMTNKGVIKRGEIDRWVKLTATFTDREGNSATRDYGFTVVHAYTDDEIVKMEMDRIFLAGNLKNLKEDLHLVTESKYGSSIKWYSSDENVITHKGEIKRAPSGGGKKEATLYLMVTHGDVTETREYEIGVEEEDFAYLFAYFTGNSEWQEKVYYGLSLDGYHFNTINGGNPVLESTIGNKCMRDPFIMEGQNGKYYCLVTDMHSTAWPAWANQSSIIIYESDDLIHWDKGTIIDFKQFENWGGCDRAWAPQAIWDPEFYDEETGEYGAYMIYLALRRNSGATQMYKVYTRDMKTLITEPEILYKRADDLQDIDSDIIYKDGMYYMYVKDESAGGIYVVKSEHAGGPYSERINALPRKNLNGKDVAIEGSAIFKLMNEDKYNLVYDAYGDGFFVMTETEDMVSFNQLARNEYSFDFTPRHGYVIAVSKAEVDALQRAYGKSVPERIAEKKNLILYYDFEDEKDKSGNFNDAQLAMSALIAQGIGGGRGLWLDGTSESYVTIPSEALEGLEDYTVSAWIKPDVKDNTQRVFDFGTGTNRYMFLTPYYSSGVLRGAITANSYQMEKGVNVETVIETGRWTHLVMMQDGDTMRIYIDGVLAGEEENVTLNPYELKYTLPYCYIGKSMWSADKNFDGAIDEFRIYDRALSDEEVAELFEMENPDNCNIEDNGKSYNVTFVKEDDEKLEVIVAQYNEEGILTSAGYRKIDFTENEIVTEKFDKTGSFVRVFRFESVESLKPFKQAD